MSNDLYTSTYNPDVLSCIANLSNDEVFTPPEVANAMLDLLPQELFHDPNTTFLDPACKSGVFLREIAKRLLVGLADGLGQEIKPLPGGSIWDARSAAERLGEERRRMDLEGRSKLDMDEPSQPAPNAAAELSQEEARKAADAAMRTPEVAPPVNAP